MVSPTALFSLLGANKVTATTDDTGKMSGKPLGTTRKNRARTAQPQGEVSSGKPNNPTIQFHVEPLSVDVSRRKLETIRLYAENIHRIHAQEIMTIGMRAKRMVQQRMKQGKNLRGGRFAPLSTIGTRAKPRKQPGDPVNTQRFFTPDGNSYVGRKRQRILRGTNSVPSNSVKPPFSNLFATGALVKSMQVRRSSRVPVSSAFQSKTKVTNAPGITISFSGAAQRDKAAMLNAGTYNMPSRPFIGLTRGEQGILTRSFLRTVRTGLGKEILRIRAMR